MATVRLEVAGDLAGGGATTKAGVKLSAAVKPASGAARKAGVYFADADRKEPRYRSTDEVIGVQDGWKLSAAHLKQRQTSYWLLDPPLKLAAGDQLVVSVAGDAGLPVRVSISPLACVEPAGRRPARPCWRRRDAADAAAPAGHGRTSYLRTCSAPPPTPTAFAKYKALQRQIAECRDGKAWTQVTVAQKPIVTRVLPPRELAGRDAARSCSRRRRTSCPGSPDAERPPAQPARPGQVARRRPRTR